MPVSLEVWGNYALFSRPELKTERVSYDVMTPSAARGLIEAIFWHPGLRYTIDRIHVCAPIRTMNLRRNEVKSTVSARAARTVMERGRGELYLATPDDIQQRAALLLRDVRYVIEAHFDMTPHPQAPHPSGTILSPALFRLPGISRPVPAVQGSPPLPGGTEGGAGSGIYALGYGLLRPGKHHPPLLPGQTR